MSKPTPLEGEDELRIALQIIFFPSPIPAIMHPDAKIQIDKAMAFIRSYTATKEREALETGQLIGVAKVLDNLWENSYYSLGSAASNRIEKEMIYYFGEDWTTTMYHFMTKDGVSKPSLSPVPVKTLATLNAKEKEV